MSALCFELLKSPILTFFFWAPLCLFNEKRDINTDNKYPVHCTDDPWFPIAEWIKPKMGLSLRLALISKKPAPPCEFWNKNAILTLHAKLLRRAAAQQESEYFSCRKCQIDQGKAPLGNRGEPSAGITRHLHVLKWGCDLLAHCLKDMKLQWWSPFPSSSFCGQTLQHAHWGVLATKQNKRWNRCSPPWNSHSQVTGDTQ